MTTARQVKAFARQLMARHSDLALVGQWIILKPVRHVLRGVLFDRTSSADYFRPRWAFVPLCEPLRSLPLNWGERIRTDLHPSWQWSDPTAADDLYRLLENETLPFLRGIETLDDFVAATTREQFPRYSLDFVPLRKIVVDVARGDLESARAICGQLLSGRTMWSAPDLREEFSRVVDPLCPLLATDDRAGITRLLREWETYTARNVGVEAIWEPTPFPLELQRTEE